jgi:hypothetical protein
MRVVSARDWGYSSKYTLLYLFPYGFGIHGRNLSSSHLLLAGSYHTLENGAQALTIRSGYQEHPCNTSEFLW